MVEQNNWRSLKNRVFDDLTQGLAKNLTYHSVAHISMVLRDATFLGHKAGLNKTDMRLLRTAALLHDYGFVYNHKDHEARSCQEAEKILPLFGYTPEEMKIIFGMIMATKIPQTPKNILEEILCDADLFYLGSDYYFEIAHLFNQELKSLDILHSAAQWKKIQTTFLESHHFFQPFSHQYLEPKKQSILKMLQSNTFM